MNMDKNNLSNFNELTNEELYFFNGGSQKTEYAEHLMNALANIWDFLTGK